MADQFCRIVDTGICDMTLGSDASQAILTTDANTAFVIREAYKTDSCTASSFCTKFNFEMDGHVLHEGLESSAAGTTIVPHSSTFCIKETSGNYPLTYKDITILDMPNPVCSVCCSCEVTLCSVNDVTTGSVTCGTPFSTSWLQCCGCVCSYGISYYNPSADLIFQVCKQSTGAVTGYQAYCYNAACSCCTTVRDGAFCIAVAGINKDYYYFACCNNPLCIAAHGACQCPCSTFVCIEHAFGFQGCCAPSLCMSAAHPCYGASCRAIAARDGRTTCRFCEIIYLAHIDIDAASPLNQIDANNQYLMSVNRCILFDNAPFYCSSPWNSTSAYYDCDCDKWLFVESSGSCIVFIDPDTCDLLFQTLPFSPFDTVSTMEDFVLTSILSTNDDNFGKKVGAKLRDVRANGSSAALYTFGDSLNCGCCVNSSGLFPHFETVADACASCYDINPSTKLTIYGIKST